MRHPASGHPEVAQPAPGGRAGRRGAEFGDLAKLGKAALQHVPLLKTAFNAVNKALRLAEKALEDLLGEVASKATKDLGATKRDLVATLIQLDRAIGKLQTAVVGAGTTVVRRKAFKAPIAQVSKKVEAIAAALPEEVAEDVRVKALLRRLRIRVADMQRRAGGK